MNTPPLLLGLSLLFWGWQTGNVAVGAVLGILLEIPRLTRARWSISPADYDRLWNLSAFIFLGTAAYLFLSEGTLSFNDLFIDAGRRPEAIRQKGQAALIWFQWTPMVFFPFVIASAWSDQPLVNVSTFSWFARRYRHTPQSREWPMVNVAFPYFALVLFAAAASNTRTGWFYSVLCALVAWALWSQRTRRYSAAAWAIVFTVVAIGGRYSHVGLARLERAVEDINLTWFSRFAALDTDMRQARTALGSIGKLKLSDKIVLRLRTDGQAPPALLREASYNIYRPALSNWAHTNKAMLRLFAEITNSSTWIVTNKPFGRSVNIARYLNHGFGILPVPAGVAVFAQLPVEELEHNPLGAFVVKGGPGLVLYDAHYQEGKAVDSPPGPDDLESSDQDDPAINQVARQIGLTNGMKAPDAIRAVQRYFTDNFSYTSYLTIGHVATTNESALARFLLHERTGHCEYFATATTLLLRKAGLPTRYAIGYSVQEGSGKRYVVREKHAHAWSLVYYRNAWHDLDTTPGSWSAMEAHSSWTRPIRDFFSNIWFQFSKWRWASTEWRKYLLWLPVPLVLVALGVFFFKKQWRSLRRHGDASHHPVVWPGLDSEFYAVERLLAARGLQRNSAEALGSWLARIREYCGNTNALRSVVALHERYRFDPQGLNGAERAALRQGAEACLRELKTRK